MIRAIITGSTGMVGEGVLYECLNSDKVESVLVVNRRSCGYTHPKLTEVLYHDFMDITPIVHHLAGYNACYFCLGTTSIGKNEEVYTRNTYDLTMHFCTIVAEKNPGITICYVSGAGTDSTERGKLMWARVKGKTENAIMDLHNVHGFAFRPGIIKPTKGLKFTQKGYKYFMWAFSVIRLFSKNGYCTLKEIGQAMINVSSGKYDKSILEVKDIIHLAKQS